MHYWSRIIGTDGDSSNSDGIHGGWIDPHGCDNPGLVMMLTADGFDGCLIGKDSKDRAIYDADAMIELLMIRDGMDRDDAVEYFWFNIDGSHMGDETPIYVFLNYDR